MLINEQIKAETIPNPIVGLPSYSTADLVTLMRIDSTMGTPRIAGYLKTAYRTVNRQIPICQAMQKTMETTLLTTVGTCVWEHAPTLYSHHHRLEDHKPKPTYNDFLDIIRDKDWQDTYQDAVLYEAAALMGDNNLDFDTIGQGVTRGVNERVKSDSLRRISQHAIADLRGISRNRIKLL